MNVQIFIRNYYEAFSAKAELPIAFWYSDSLCGELKQTQGCLFKLFDFIRNGEIISMNAATIGCGGGKFYTGFTPMPEYVPNFVSMKERYKQTPEMVTEQIKNMNVQTTSNLYIHFARVDKLDSFENIEGLFFLVPPDILSGLCTWAFFDNNSSDAVSTVFGSGCSSTITLTTNENKIGGRRTFLGFFDPSVRPYVESNILSFAIPLSRFKEMYETIRVCCLHDTPAWNKVLKRISI